MYTFLYYLINMVERAIIPENIFDYKNVNGYSKVLLPKLKDGVLNHDIEVIRIYVEKKQPLSELHESWVLPQSIGDIPIDIVEIGKVEAQVDPVPKDGRHQQVRPMMSGISVGHVAITAGTLGHLSKYTDGELYATSNAHVLTPNPSFEVGSYTDNRIVQPGKYDDLNIGANHVGEYFWHERIYPISQTSTCPITKAVVWTFNTIASLGWKSRLSSYVAGTNYHDFAAFKIKDGIGYDQTKTFDFELTDYTLSGRLFAGSASNTILCKIKYEVAAGFIPEVSYIDEPNFMDELRKSGRTTGDTTGKVMDVDGVINVNYGNFTAKIK